MFINRTLVNNDAVLHIQWKMTAVCSNMESSLRSSIYTMKLVLYKINIYVWELSGKIYSALLIWLFWGWGVKVG